MAKTQCMVFPQNNVPEFAIGWRGNAVVATPLLFNLRAVSVTLRNVASPHPTHTPTMETGGKATSIGGSFIIMTEDCLIMRPGTMLVDPLDTFIQSPLSERGPIRLPGMKGILQRRHLG
eukprot:TRINITY_DN1760_c0_g1_i1.p5 TRINITY_DN1760_c0_g1~~TRINITY_DN1760_c0_g1_i1.p5  ORF type:complete len:119 (+),score=9.89 TRINITY_DN1760_c0_g1_i1:269-625(+)